MSLRVSIDEVLAYRYRANHLDKRLKAGSEPFAARAGLQDSGPRAGVISLHARVNGVTASLWEQPDMAQVWGPRGAIYIVPRNDIAVFTLGQLPRDSGSLKLIEKAVASIKKILAGRTLRKSEVLSRFRSLNLGVDFLPAGKTGSILPRWDARDTLIRAVDAPDADIEECRIELARRFFHYLGPSTLKGLKQWAGISREDAQMTFSSLSNELLNIEVDGHKAWCLESDVDDLNKPRAKRGVRLLPADDPYLNYRTAKEFLVPEHKFQLQLWPKAPPPGALLVDGIISGIWRRNQWHFVFKPWRKKISNTVADAVTEEISRFPLQGDPTKARVEWLSPLKR